LLVELSHDVWVAHNVEFDLRMLTQEYGRLGRTLQLPKLSVCTKNLSAVFGGGKGNRLFHTAERYGIPQEDAHRAVVDARVCGQILAKWVETGRVPGSDSEMEALCKKADASWRGKHRW
jgi:DNA polymerase III epsilon subunit-like protein